MSTPETPGRDDLPSPSPDGIRMFYKDVNAECRELWRSVYAQVAGLSTITNLYGNCSASVGGGSAAGSVNLHGGSVNHDMAKQAAGQAVKDYKDMLSDKLLGKG